MVFEVYLDPCTVNSRKVLAGLDLLGTEYHFNHVDYFGGEHKKPEYLEINPCATVPCAVDDGLTITESNAILMYAADRDGGNSAYPKDLKQRADVNRWLLWEASVWFPSCYVYLVEYVAKPLLTAEPDQSIIDAQAPRWHQLATILNSQLAKTKWLAGGKLTIADIAVAASIHLHAAQRLPLDQHPHLKRWMRQDIESLPCWQKTQCAVNKALLPNAAAGNGTTSRYTQVHSTLNYTKDLSPKLTEVYFYETPAAKNIHEPGDDPHDVAVHDGWHLAKEFSIDKQGFSLHDFKTGFETWENEEAVRTNFYPEVVDFLKKTVGAKRVLVFDHTIRSKVNEAKKLTEETNTSQRAPVMLVHCDYTAESGPLRVQQLLGNEAEELLSRRVAFINVWKPIHNVVEERPLAMCDVTTSPPEDFFKLHLRYRERSGENYLMSYSPKHKWWYFPKMTPEQLILLKTYDSETDGRARFVGHSAFDDPTSPPNAPMRQSIETRTIVFF
jgi:glutathione S-transferase